MKVTSFADVTDLRRYNIAIDNGKSLRAALADGDNGVGAWGKSTVAGTGAAFAVHNGQRHRTARITVGGRSIVAECRDLAPDGVIDLNPDACAELGLTPPVLATGDFEWI
jgi:hypothetical protein